MGLTMNGVTAFTTLPGNQKTNAGWSRRLVTHNVFLLRPRRQQIVPSHLTLTREKPRQSLFYCWHYLFFWMGVLGELKNIITTNWTRQCINWWLGYVLSQPVDIDLSVLFYFARCYVGMNESPAVDSIPPSFSHESDTIS